MLILFLAFSGYRTTCFLFAWSKETKLSNQQASPSTSKNTEVILAPWRAPKYATAAISGGVDIWEVPYCHLLHCMTSQQGSYNLRINVSWTHRLLFWFLTLFWLTARAILSKVCKRYKFETHNSLKNSALPIFEVFIAL